jgi:EAL domain-containing protein (putative c-di-GMP-specific phosphodiesterase class I)
VQPGVGARVTRGLISPLDFIPVAEETGIIYEVERWVRREALAGLRTVLDQLPGRARLSVSVNLSPFSIRGRDLVNDVRDALDSAGIPPELLTIEVTESALLRDNESTGSTLTMLKEMGGRLAIDHFGAGYSSLTYLTMCDFDVLKMDRTFIKDMVGVGETAPIARAILAMAKILDLEVIAEGAETVHQVARLREMGCRLAQGDYYSPPVDLAALAALVHREYARDERGVIVKLPQDRRGAAGSRGRPRLVGGPPIRGLGGDRRLGDSARLPILTPWISSSCSAPRPGGTAVSSAGRAWRSAASTSSPSRATGRWSGSPVAPATTRTCSRSSSRARSRPRRRL